MHKFALASQHFVGGSKVETPIEKNERGETNPEKAAMVHGRVEHKVQLRLSGLPSMIRFCDMVQGHMAVRGESNSKIAVEDRPAAMRWGFNMLGRKRRRWFKKDEVVPISNALYALSKLFSGAGDHKRYYLNESDLLKGEQVEHGNVILM
jgi:hypothetical protein